MKPRAFTLIELMVAIGIIVLVAAMLLPAVGNARKSAARSALQADLQTITLGIAAYQNDFGSIPRPDKFTPPPFQGSEILCWALLAPGPATFDGADGFGFRTRGTLGTIHGPYLSPRNFQFGVVTTSAKIMPLIGAPDAHTCIGDRAGNAILYFPSKLSATTVTTATSYFGPPSRTTRYASKDNDPAIATGTEFGPNPNAASALNMMRALLPGVSTDGITLDPTKLLELPYLLWDAGPDGRFATSDDVTNFRP